MELVRCKARAALNGAGAELGAARVGSGTGEAVAAALLGWRRRRGERRREEEAAWFSPACSVEEVAQPWRGELGVAGLRRKRSVAAAERGAWRRDLETTWPVLFVVCSGH